MKLRRLESLRVLARQIGVVNAGKLAIATLLPRSYEMQLTPSGFDQPLYCRSGKSSDQYVFRQIFALKEYAPLNLNEPKLIVDCGANVGYSAAHFLHTFPSAHLVAIEPDPGNLRVLRKNVAPFAKRVDVIHGGIWSSNGNLKTVRGAFADGREWATIVRPAAANENSDTRAFDIPSVVPPSYSRIDLLKIDIEGSEIELFRAHSNQWLPMVENIAIELHSTEANKVFFEALRPYDYDLSRSSELTICRNLKLKANSEKTLSAGV